MRTLDGPLWRINSDPITGRLLIVGCSARKVPTSQTLPALELYDGGCIPSLRERFAGKLELRSRIRFLSAEHGLITADTPLQVYDRALDSERATALRPLVQAALYRELARDGAPEEVLVIAEPLYLVLLADLLALPERPRVHWLHNYATAWPQARVLLDNWGWK